MTTYKVTSDRLADHKLGDIVTDDALANVNIDALIEGGHIKPQASVKPVDKPDNKE